MITQLRRCIAFKALHANKAGWIIPNPWDVGSARVLEGLGFKALATTSGGYAFTLGKADGAVTLEEMLQHCAALVAGTQLPINADFENGYAEDINEMVANITRLAATGVSGISIEDFSREDRSIYSLSESVERVQAAVEAIAATGIPILLTARAESLLRGFDDLDDIIERLQAYAAVGADVLYAPAIRSLDALKTVTIALDRPFNVLAPFIRGATVQQLAAAGGTRISVGGTLTYASVAPLLQAGKEMLEHGSFDWVAKVANSVEVKSLLKL